MREGLKVWTGYTNDWKNHPRSDQADHWKSARALALGPAFVAVTSRAKLRADGGIEFNPKKRGVLPACLPEEDAENAQG